jgi:hypothetical protein
MKLCIIRDANTLQKIIILINVVQNVVRKFFAPWTIIWLYLLDKLDFVRKPFETFAYHFVDCTPWYLKF